MFEGGKSMKLKALLKQIPIYQGVVLVENMKEIASGDVQNEDIISFGEKTVGLIRAEENKIRISVYDYSKN
jgi:hypothetical protein